MKKRPQNIISIFISYSRRDYKPAEFLAQTLKGRGYNIWIDIEGIPGGANWSQEIKLALNEADVVIFLISKHSLNSQVLEAELLSSISLEKRIIPVRLDSSPIPEILATIQFIDVSGSSLSDPLVLDRIITAIEYSRNQDQRVSSNHIAASDKMLEEVTKADRVFIAYSRKQRPLAKELSEWLNVHNKPNFYDAKLRAGVVWRQKIQKALDDATHMIIIWTPEAQKSNEVDREVSYALAEGKIIIPLLSPEIPKLPYHLHGLQYVVLKENISDIEQELVDAFERFSEDEDLWR